MTRLNELPTAPLLAAGLVGGFVLAQKTKQRPLGGAVMAVANAAALPAWQAKGGPVTAAALTTGYWAAMGVSHPLAKKVGTWPAVFGVAAAAAAAAYVGADRRSA